MNKLLPNTLDTRQGFTLIELLITISIVAILAVVGISVFSGAQSSARDSRRLSEVLQLAKSIETAKDASKIAPGGGALSVAMAAGAGPYSYANVDLDRDFPSGRPSDPNSTAGREYCISTITAVAVNNTVNPNYIGVPNTVNAAGCPTAIPTGAGNTYSAWTAVTKAAGISVPAGTIGWVICASSERGTNPFCAASMWK